MKTAVLSQMRRFNAGAYNSWRCVRGCGLSDRSFAIGNSSGLLRAGNGFKTIDRAFEGRFPFGFGHVRSGVPELHAGRQTLATAAWGLQQVNTGASARGQTYRYDGGR